MQSGPQLRGRDFVRLTFEVEFHGIVIVETETKIHVALKTCSVSKHERFGVKLPVGDLLVHRLKLISSLKDVT